MVVHGCCKGSPSQMLVRYRFWFILDFVQFYALFTLFSFYFKAGSVCGWLFSFGCCILEFLGYLRACRFLIVCLMIVDCFCIGFVLLSFEAKMFVTMSQ